MLRHRCGIHRRVLEVGVLEVPAGLRLLSVIIQAVNADSGSSFS